MSFLSLPVLVHQPSHSIRTQGKIGYSGTRTQINHYTKYPWECISNKARVYADWIDRDHQSSHPVHHRRVHPHCSYPPSRCQYRTYGDTGAQYSSALGPKFIDSRCKEGEIVKAWVKPEYRRNTVSSSCSRSTLMPFVPMCCSMVYPNNLQPLWMESEMRVRIPASKTSELFVLGINVAATVTGSRRKTIGMTQRCLDLESVLSVVIPYLWQ